MLLYTVIWFSSLSFSQAAVFHDLSFYQSQLPVFICCPLVHLRQSLLQFKVCSHSVSSGVRLPSRQFGLQTVTGESRGKNALLHTQIHTSSPATSHACLLSQTDLTKLFRQILGRNSICRGDERYDRGERGG